MQKYDVVIVGAGVSGLMLARYLDKTKLKVLLLEKKKCIESTPFSFGTFTEIAKKHNLQRFVRKYFDTWAFYGPTVKAARTQTKSMCVVDYGAFAKSLKFKNVKVKTGVELRKARRVEGGIQLFDKKHSYNGRLVIDSSGYVQVVKQLLGLPVYKQSGLSFETELEGGNIPVKNEASFILDFRTSNSGGWLYVFSKSKAQYGWADFYPESQSTLKDLRKRTLWAKQHLEQQGKWLKNAKVTYEFGRFGPTGNRKHEVFDNLIAVGDAGGCGTPVTLEGFREATDSAEMAYEVIKKAKDFKKEDLQPFLKKFYDAYGKYYRMHHIVRYAYLHWMRNDDLDRWISNFKKFSKKDFFKLIRGELTASLMLRTLDLKLTGNLLLNMINNVLPSFLRFRRKITPSKKEVLYEKG